MITKTIELKYYGYLTIFFGIIDLLNMALDVSEINGLMAASSQADTIFTYRSAMHNCFSKAPRTGPINGSITSKAAFSCLARIVHFSSSAI